jgi:hypothetical protein
VVLVAQAGPLRAARQKAEGGTADGPTLDGKRFRETWHNSIKDYNRIVGVVAADDAPTAGTIASSGIGDDKTPQPQTAVDNPRRKRGRPEDPEVKKRDEDMRNACREGRYENASDLARAFKVDPSYARRIAREVKAQGGK